MIEAVDPRTQLVGHNHLELLLFKLGTTHTFGINVFKVREAITKLPFSHPVIRGAARIRAISIFDL
jgi:two-component system chemotaxis response regulator CheV